MKHIITIIFIFFEIFANAQNLKAYFNHSEFWSPNNGEYIEIYFNFIGNTSTFIKNSNNKYNSELKILVTLSQKNNIKQFLKYNLKSPEIKDTSLFIPNFIDIQRLSIKPGRYKFDINITDINDSSKTIIYSDSLEINKFKNISFSDIEFLESFTKSNKKSIFNKNGYSLTPFVSDYYPSEISSFNFYTELYIRDSDINKNEGILIKYYIEPFNNNKYKLSKYTKTVRRKAEEINVIMGNFNINKLPSGNYNFVVECINKNNEIITTNKIFFQRNNKIADQLLGNIDSIKIEDTFIDNETNLDTLTEYIKCLFPIMESKQITFAINQLKTRNINLMQKFIYGFWIEHSPYNAEKNWLNYKTKVNFVNKNFSTQIKRGYETDRGRIYLKYGAPSNIIKRKQPVDSYPYEMWHYAKTYKQGNVKIVFYNPNMLNGGFELLYTNLIGESSDSNWKSTIMKSGSNGGTFGNTIDDDFRAL